MQDGQVRMTARRLQPRTHHPDTRLACLCDSQTIAAPHSSHWYGIDKLVWQPDDCIPALITLIRDWQICVIVKRLKLHTHHNDTKLTSPCDSITTKAPHSPQWYEIDKFVWQSDDCIPALITLIRELTDAWYQVGQSTLTSVGFIV